MILIKSKREIEKIAKAGAILSKVHARVRDLLKEGISTWEIDQFIENFIIEHGATPSFKGYQGFPCSACLSVNEVVIHGIASKDQILKKGDIISVDIGVYLDGYHSDAARTHLIGDVPDEVVELVKLTKEAFYKGLEMARAGNHLGDVSHAIGKHAAKNNLGIVREFTGHGVGKALHEDPPVFNYGKAGRGPILQKGMVLAIEPMFNLGCDEVRTLSDGWTVVTEDKKPSAHYEQTIVVTDEEAKILTNIFEE